MGRVLSFMLALTFAISANAAAVARPIADRSQPMHFTLYRQGSPDVCSLKCKLLISAVGDITADTPQEFKKFAREHDLTGAIVVLDSEGGSVHGAIALGREIRRFALNTTVGRVINVSKHGGVAYAISSPSADCESMCAFVLLAGVHRIVPDEARVMVHQIWLGDRREDPTAGNYSAEDLVLVQRDIGSLAQYTTEMGISIEMLDLSLRIPPWEPMHTMSRDELHRMQVISDEPDSATIKLDVGGPTDTAITLTSDDMLNAEISERQWMMIDRSGKPALARRHPLTVNGKEIGHFDLLFSCSSVDESYNVKYIELRHKGEDAPQPDALRIVSLRFGNQLATLKVISSMRQDNSDELVTLASGPVPVALVDYFTALGDHSLTIETESEALATSIRVGNTGVQQSMLKFASTCPKPLSAHAELNVINSGNVASAK
jgi:hypothetical protein